MRRALLTLSLAAAFWAAVIWLAGPLRLLLFGLRISATDPERPLIVAVIGVAVYAAFWRRELEREVRTVLRSPIDRPGTVANALAVIVFAVGVSFGSTTAAGADSHGYLSQADLWRHGRLIVREDIINHVPWPNAAWTFAPLGYRPAARVADGIVPTYAPGLPLLMALCQAVVGYCGAFLLAPLFGAAVVRLTYILGARLLARPALALWAAAAVATSPAFFYQLLWPLSDIPATAMWTLALLLVVIGRPWSAGIAIAATLAIRPNLLPLPASLLVWAVVRDVADREHRGRFGYAIPLAIGVLPAIAGIAALNTYLYGAPTASGYGNPAGYYTLGHVPLNLVNYSSWILETETPLIALAVVFFVAPKLVAPTTAIPFPRLLLGGTIAGVVLSYIFYVPFDAWWYLRFLLPMWPVLMLLTVGGIDAVFRAAGRARSFAVAGCLLVFVGRGAYECYERRLFSVGRDERRYVDAARFVAAHTEPGAIIISMQHSGSIRHYTGRVTLRYDQLGEAWLDKSVAHLQAIGRRPYLMLDNWEEEQFRARFARRNRLGALDWPPIAVLRGGGQIMSLFDLVDTGNTRSPVLMPADAINQRTGWPCEHPARK